jgi:CDP-diacylglycerol--glycerol-3-phosphate 3-phosphatidyltransferase
LLLLRGARGGLMTTVFTLPNLLSACRIALAPVLVVLAATGQHHFFLGLLAVSLATDALDGYLARLLRQESALGVKLDSWGDLLTYITMILGLWLLWPQLFMSEIWFLLLGIGFYCLPMLAGLFKFGVLPKFHTWAAKLAALLIAPAYFVLTLWGYALPFRIVIAFHVWVAIEELLIVFILSRNQYNVPTFIHARNLSRRARIQLQKQRQKMQDKRGRLQERRSKKREERGDL